MFNRELLDKWGILLPVNVGVLWATAILVRVSSMSAITFLVAVLVVSFDYIATKPRMVQTGVPRYQYFAGLFMVGMIALATDGAARKLPIWLVPMPLLIGTSTALFLMRFSPSRQTS